MTNTQDEASTSAHDERPAASSLFNISDDLHDLRRFVDGVWMAAGDVSAQTEILALRALLDVAGEKIDAMIDAMQAARDTLASERKETV